MSKVIAGLLAILLGTTAAAAQSAATALPAISFDEAVRRAIENNPSVAEAAQSILRAENALQQARTVLYPTVSGTVTTTVLNDERGFENVVTQPQTQSAFGASFSYPVLAASRWAQRAQAQDQIRVARIGVDETRRQIAIAAAQAYLGVIAQRRLVEVGQQALDLARAQYEFAKARLDAGAGSKLNEVRAAQEVETDIVLLETARLGLHVAQEALGLLIAAEGPVDAAAEPALEIPPMPADESWLTQRTDVQLFSAQIQAADRVVRDSWRDWVPSGNFSLNPQYATPAGVFQPSSTWNAVVQFAVPVFDGGQRRVQRTQREIAAQTARIQLTDVELQARAELRTARARVESTERALVNARLAAQHAAEVVRITDVAYRAGATTNLELLDAQQRARNADTAAAQAEDRLRRSRLDLLVALGRFPQ